MMNIGRWSYLASERAAHGISGISQVSPMSHVVRNNVLPKTYAARSFEN